MITQKVVLITKNDFDNLGVGYLTAYLRSKGIEGVIVNLTGRKDAILNRIRSLDPILVGFSVIFMNHFHLFKKLITYLRQNGIKCHFTAGGHYASLKYKELLEGTTELDSVIRFEGEYTLYELVTRLQNGEPWNDLKGIAFKDYGSVITNHIRDLERELDRFPYPDRIRFRKYAFGKRFVTIIAGRGCLHNCSFCNTREFYKQAGGPLKRVRKPEAVVGEMSYLYNEKGCSVFLFNDDDFPIKSAKGHDWINNFCKEIDKQGLKGQILWQIDCRVDDIDEECFEKMKMHGLFLVFIGIDDGTDKGLATLNKNVSIDENIKGISILKKLGIGFDYGFMLFQPSTTFISFFENLRFMHDVLGDGYTPIAFLKLIPIYSTRVEMELKASGRLVKDGLNEEYRFREEKMNDFCEFAMSSFKEWQTDPRGLVNLSKWARNYFLVYFHYLGVSPSVRKYHNKVRKHISDSNAYIIQKLKSLAEHYSECHDPQLTFLEEANDEIGRKHDLFKNRILTTMSDFLSSCSVS